jgi:hypothetical protein
MLPPVGWSGVARKLRSSGSLRSGHGKEEAGMPKGPKRIVVLVVGVIAGLVSLVWIGQGSGVIKGSFMTGSDTWLGIGLVCLSVGTLLIFLALRKPPAKQATWKSR